MRINPITPTFHSSWAKKYPVAGFVSKSLKSLEIDTFTQNHTKRSNNRMKVRLVQHCGSDQQIADIAGISYDKEMSSKERLIPFLIKNGHQSPFEHTLLTFYVEIPIYIARQLVRHRIGVSFNEMSRRYVDSEPEFDVTLWGGEGDIDYPIGGLLADIKKMYISLSKGNLRMREFARQILPMCTTTKMYVSFNLRSFWHFQELRNSTHAQAEMKQFAEMLLAEVEGLEEFSLSTTEFKNATR